MKAALLSFLFVLVLALPSLGQRIDANRVPAGARAAASRDFPGMTVLRWERKAMRPPHFEAVMKEGSAVIRARYLENGSPLYLSRTYRNGEGVPSQITASTLAAYPGFTLNWVIDVDNKLKSRRLIHLRLSKPGTVIQANVNPDGTPFTGTEIVEGIPAQDQPPADAQ
jgi:hypothetical protein